MKRMILAASIAASCILTGCAYTDYLKNHVFTATGGAVSGSFATASPKKEESDEIHTVSGSGIVTADFVTADMQKESYWINHTVTADKIILSEKEIAAWNKKYNTEQKESFATVTKEPFLVVLGNSLSVGSNTYGMGDKISLFTDAEKEKWLKEHGQEDCTDTYLADIPLSFMGESTNIPTPVPISESVCIGYLDYTKANVLHQSFQYLGQLNLTDEEETVDKRTEFVKRIYACFGISLPSKREGYTALNDSTIELSKMSAQEKIEKLNSIEAGTLLDFSGNIGIYLGCAEQKHYAIGYFGYTCSIREITKDSPENQPDEHTWLTDLTKIYKIN